MAFDRRDAVGLLVFLGLVGLVAVIGALSTTSARSTYEDLQGPAWAPPGWLFGPVWTALYAAIAVSGWLAWRTGMRPREPGMILYATQLILNAAWSPLFFALSWRGAALILILALDATVIATIAQFWRRRRTTAWLLMPYLAWILFATGLNAAYWSMNR